MCKKVFSYNTGKTQITNAVLLHEVFLILRTGPILRPQRWRALHPSRR